MTLNEIQIILVEKELKAKGLNYTPLEDEVLDHVCCLIELQMTKGLSFAPAKDQVFLNLDNEALGLWQKATQHAVNKNKNLMKRITIITTGLAASCFLITSVIKAQEAPSINPLENVVVTSHFGMRMDPINKKKRLHYGIDLKAAVGTPVNVTAPGVITKVVEDPQGYGKYILVDHGENIFTRYAQLSEFRVKEGDTVKKGQIIALAGSSGASTAPHLHYEVIKDNKRVDPIDYMSNLEN